MKPEDRITSTQITIPRGGGKITTHFYSRYTGDETELWMFGTGLGDQSAMSQIGDCFLSLIDEGKDPQLGRIMMSLGKGATSFIPYKGDHNIVWAWGLKPEELKEYLDKFQTKPQWVLSPYKALLDEAESLGYRALKFLSGVNPRFFKPLPGRRTKPGDYGFAGLPKSKEQQRIVLEPAMENGELEWITKNPHKEFKTLVELNAWYNTKRILFGMVDEDRHDMTFVPTRFFETLASGTPLITYRIKGIEEHTGIRYPYMTTCKEETDYWIYHIEENYYQVMSNIKKWGKHIRDKHSYKTRLMELFSTLEGNV